MNCKFELPVLVVIATASITLAGCDSDYRVAGKELPINQLLTVALQQAPSQKYGVVDLPTGVTKINCYVPTRQLYCDVYVDTSYADVAKNPLPWTMELATWRRDDGVPQQVDEFLLHDTKFNYVIERRADRTLQVRASVDQDRVPLQEAQSVIIKGLAVLNRELSPELADRHAEMASIIRGMWNRPSSPSSRPTVTDETNRGAAARAAASAAGDGSEAGAQR
ncbi:hypothetical protein [Burkholderia ubonensis]|uniref:hypothetical protein n=1 Tax=Burkholderia ubonensis TaxID=101571 RepID=UPI000A9F39C2|nr:hypothetical protein [Burkholderia ubonensis]